MSDRPLASTEAEVPEEAPPASKRFGCAVPGCHKVFRRKEHLTRHLKSHGTQLQYACHICGRRYARSDVLKRHVEFHPQYQKPERNFVACTRCRESKTKCDEGIPCRPCSRRSLTCVRANARADVAADSAVPEAPRNHSSPSSPSTHAFIETSLRQHIVKDPAVAQRRLRVYFAEIHPDWPILHAPTVTVADTPDILIASITMLASWLEGDGDHLTLAPLVFDEFTNVQLSSALPLPMLQAMALYLLYAICRIGTEGMITKALKIHHTLVTACRFSTILNAHGGLWYSTGDDSFAQGTQEERYRLAFATLRIDAYFSVLTDWPPLIRYQELSMPLSQTTEWERVTSEEERRKLLEDEPVMRKKTAFRFRVHDIIGTPRLNALAPPWTKMDYHFILCAIQSGAWEAVHQSLRSVPEDLHSRTHDEDIRNLWRQRLKTWMDNLEKDCLLHAPTDLWHLQGRYYKIRPIARPVKQNSSPALYLQPWSISKFARVAVWHGAQIARIASKELALENSANRLLLNPLVIPALLTSAIVVCAYAYNARACPMCTGGDPVDLVNVFSAPDDCERLARWKEEGVGLADWGPNIFSGFPLCRCSMIKLSDWFRARLDRDKQADAALVLFLDELKSNIW
ncbi:hypothetical protein F5Y19DRAFT_479134 [Xylariaceae sp. FL1651]|nr:hypothetical protein F5Y19DRAFT_479134 [Xylariaceae sp. FL1651]